MPDIEGFKKAAKAKGLTDEQINQALASKGYKTSTTSSTTPTPQAGMLEKSAPVLGDILGGFLGPIGAGAGYSIGRSGQEISKQMRTGGQDVLANIIGQNKSQDLTPYGQQRSNETFGQDFDFGKEAISSLVSPEGLKSGGEFALSNLIQSLVAGGSDLILGGAGKPANQTVFGKNLLGPAQNMGGIIPALFSKGLPNMIRGGGNTLEKLGIKGAKDIGEKAAGRFPVRGVTPSAIQESAGNLKKEAWKPIQEAIDTFGDTKSVPINTVRETIMERGTKLMAPYVNEPAKAIPPATLDKLKAIDTIISGMDNLADDAGNVSITQLNDLLNNYSEAYSAVTGLPKLSSDAAKNEYLSATRQAKYTGREQQIKSLAKTGLPEEEAKRLLNEYGALSKLINDLRNPLKGLFQGGFATQSLRTGTGGALSGGPGVLGLLLSFMPYGRQLIKEAVTAPLRYGGAPAGRAVTGSILNSLIKEQ